MEGGSCTVPTGLFPLGRLSAEEKTIYMFVLLTGTLHSSASGNKRSNFLFKHNNSTVIAVGGCHHQHFLSVSMTNNPHGGQSDGCPRQGLTRTSKRSPVFPVGATAKSETQFGCFGGSTLIMPYCSHGATGLHRSSKHTPTQTNRARRALHAATNKDRYTDGSL